MGGVPIAGNVPRLGWGGARNSANRTSDAVTLAQARNVIAAADFADAIGLSLNRFVTIHWEAAGIADRDAASATRRFIKLANDTITKSGGRSAYSWVRENGDGKGSHVHILLHVPSGLEPWNRGKRWVSAISGCPYHQAPIKTDRIGGTARAWQTAPAVYRQNLANLVGYILKGANPLAVRTLGLERIEPGGRIMGKRVSTSQNIGRAARRTAGWAC